MTNIFYSPTGTPASHSQGLSQNVRNEFSLIEQGFAGVQAFLGGNGLKLSGVNLYSASGTIPNAQLGSLVYYNGSADGTLTLPDVTSFAVGSVLAINNINAGECTVQRQGASLLYAGHYLLGVTSVKLRRGQSIILASNGVDWIQLGGQFDDNADMTGYDGADFKLGLNKPVFYDLTAATTLEPRIATADNQIYEACFQPNYGANVNLTGATLQMNGANFGSNVVQRWSVYGINNTTPGSFGTGENVFTIGNGGTVYFLEMRICTRTKGKTVRSLFKTVNVTDHQTGLIIDTCSDTTTPWTSLGQFNFPAAVTGRMSIRRIF